MPVLLRLCLLLALWLAVSTHATKAEESSETVTPRHAVAMHGEPAYGPDFTQFNYVNPDAPKGGTLRNATVGTFDSLNPFIVKGTPAAGMTYLGQGLLYDSLMEQSYDEPFSMYGLLAESIEIPESRNWVAFNLRPEARWDDGQPVTAEDVVWTFNTLMEKGLPFYKAYYGDVTEATAETPLRVKFTFAHGGNAELPLILSQLTVLPKHYWTQDGNDFSQTTLKPPLGSGPYRIGAVSPGQSIEYERVKDWWGANLPVNKGRFNFDKIRYDYYGDANVALEAFFAGEYDIQIENTAKLWATAYDAPPVKDGRIAKEEIPHGRPAGMQAFLYNLRRPVFQDKAVREALAYAFDFEWSNKQFAYGAYERTRSYFANSALASSGLPEGRELEILEKYRGKIPDEIFEKEYRPPVSDGSGRNRKNLAEATKILDAAGYALGKDGVRVNEKTGVRLEFEIVDANPQFERWVLPFIKNLEKIGVKASFRVIDPAQYQNRMNDFDFDMTIGSIPQSDSPGNEQRDFWNSQKADIHGSRNYIGVQDPVVDALIEAIIEAPSREELVARCHALDRVLLWGYYVIPQWHVGQWRVAYWQNLARPEKLSPLTLGVTDSWWAK